jgi:hypothetical protein
MEALFFGFLGFLLVMKWAPIIELNVRDKQSGSFVNLSSFKAVRFFLDLLQ